MTTPSFNVDSSPWKLQFRASWTGHFALQLKGAGSSTTLVNRGVVAGEIYETFVHDMSGTYYFTASSAEASGVWDVWVVENPVTVTPTS